MRNPLLACALLLLFTAPVAAVETGGKVHRFYVNKDGTVLFSLDSEVNQRPSCANNNMWQYAFSIESTAGKEMYSMLLAAKLSGKPLLVGYGTASCSPLFPALGAIYIYFNE